tara:strand:+ start:1556 stop:1747 length:192 start_codon:yes stop_codon:yes gene_type:complete
MDGIFNEKFIKTFVCQISKRNNVINWIKGYVPDNFLFCHHGNSTFFAGIFFSFVQQFRLHSIG